MEPTTSQNPLQWPATPPLAPVPTIDSRAELADPESLVGKAVSITIGSAASAKRFGVKLSNNGSEPQRILFYIDGIGTSNQGGVHGRVLLSPTDPLPALIDNDAKWLYPNAKRVWCPMNELFTAQPAAGLEVTSLANAEQFIRQAKQVKKRRDAAEKSEKGAGKLSGMLTGLLAPAVAASRVFEGIKLPRRPTLAAVTQLENKESSLPKTSPQPTIAPQQQPIPPVTPISAPVISATVPDLPDLTFRSAVANATSRLKFGKRTVLYSSLAAAAGLSFYAVLDGWIKPSHFMDDMPRIPLTKSQWNSMVGRSSTSPSSDPQGTKGSPETSKVLPSAPGTIQAPSAEIIAAERRAIEASARENEQRKELQTLQAELKSMRDQRADIRKELESIRDGLRNQIRATEEEARNRPAPKQQGSINMTSPQQPIQAPRGGYDGGSPRQAPLVTAPPPNSTIPYAAR